MKILIIQEKGRHKKNEKFRESLNFHRSFKKLNIDSIVWGLNYPNYNISFEEISKNIDVILLLENYNSGWIPNISKFKGLKIFWSIDSHVIPMQHKLTCDNNKIDIVLNSIESHKKYFPNQKCIYFPNPYPDDLIYHKPEIEKTVDVGFVGNWVNRSNWINSIPNIKKDIMVIGDDMVNEINSFKIHFNRNMSDDINYRTFETLGCNTLLLTNYTENLEKLFNIGDDLVVYESVDDLLNKINFYLENDKERLRISNNGYNNVKTNHTYYHRTKTLIDIIKSNYKKIN